MPDFGWLLSPYDEYIPQLGRHAGAKLQKNITINTLIIRDVNLYRTKSATLLNNIERIEYLFL